MTAAFLQCVTDNGPCSTAARSFATTKPTTHFSMASSSSTIQDRARTPTSKWTTFLSTTGAFTSISHSLCREYSGREKAVSHSRRELTPKTSGTIRDKVGALEIEEGGRDGEADRLRQGGTDGVSGVEAYKALTGGRGNGTVENGEVDPDIPSTGERRGVGLTTGDTAKVERIENATKEETKENERTGGERM